MLQYQETHVDTEGTDILCATSTMTKSIEEQDQDPEVNASIICATGTATATIEDQDQDPKLMATQTMTETTESPDQDAPSAGYFAIPRA